MSTYLLAFIVSDFDVNTNEENRATEDDVIQRFAF